MTSVERAAQEQQREAQPDEGGEDRGEPVVLAEDREEHQDAERHEEREQPQHRVDDGGAGFHPSSLDRRRESRYGHGGTPPGRARLGWNRGAGAAYSGAGPDRFLGLHHRRLRRAARHPSPRREQADLDPHRDPPAGPRRSALAHRRPGAPRPRSSRAAPPTTTPSSSRRSAPSAIRTSASAASRRSSRCSTPKTTIPAGRAPEPPLPRERPPTGRRRPARRHGRSRTRCPGIRRTGA